jgi:hypothetical protein
MAVHGIQILAFIADAVVDWHLATEVKADAPLSAY